MNLLKTHFSLSNDSWNQGSTDHTEHPHFAGNKHCDNLGLREICSIVEDKHFIPIPMFLLFKMLVADLRNNKSMGNIAVHRKDHLIKKLQETWGHKMF